jgi:murein DD-endopeptidase MepM/ murein hydrolase activator NlpD
MGTTGILASKPERLHAATSALPELETLNVLPNDGTSSSVPRLVGAGSGDRNSESVPSAIEHEVQSGESLWLLARVYRTTPEEIATLNEIAPSADLQIGQTLKIPTPEQLKVETGSGTSTSEQLDNVSDSLRKTREKLHESLATLRSRETLLASEPTALAPEPGNSEPGIEIPIVAPDGSSTSTERSIPIAVPTPESDRTVTAARSPRPAREATPPAIDPIDPASGLSEPGVEAPAIPAPRVIVPSASENRVYRVRPGDTLNTIARDLGIPARELARANRIGNPNRIKVNQALVVPVRPGQRAIEAGSRLTARSPVSFNPIDRSPGNSGEEKVTATITATYTEKLREDIAQLRGSYPTEQQKAISLTVEPPASVSGDRSFRNPQWTGATSRFSRPNEGQIIGSAPANVEQYNDRLRIPVGETVEPSLPPLSDPDEHLPGTPFTGYIWPTRGVLTSGFGWRWGRPHRGIDIAGPVGTPVVAAAGGEVISAGWNSGGYGNLVRLRHADGSVTLYAHNSRLLVRRGQTVEQGQPIAEMGSTGFSTGPHLHFEVHPDGQRAVNPIAFLPSDR